MNIDESLTAKGFTAAADAPGRTIEEVVIHHWGDLGQKHDDVVKFFVSGPGTTSAHFVVSAGRVTCLVSPEDVAWHAGVWAENLKSVGIECRPECSPQDMQQVAELVAWLRSQYGDLPLRAHREFKATACPGIWDLARIDREARAIVTVQPASAPAAAPTTTPKGAKVLVISQAKGDPSIWIGDGITRRQIPDAKTLEDLRKLARWGVLNIFKNGETMDYPLSALGQPIK
jgi:hypothetical protein